MEMKNPVKNILISELIVALTFPSKACPVRAGLYDTSVVIDKPGSGMIALQNIY